MGQKVSTFFLAAGLFFLITAATFCGNVLARLYGPFDRVIGIVQLYIPQEPQQQPSPPRYDRQFYHSGDTDSVRL